jgi:pimeloyl-ACP methyl ester carboxylesterase
VVKRGGGVINDSNPYTGSAGGEVEVYLTILDRLLAEFLARGQSLPDSSPVYEVNSAYGHRIAYRHRPASAGNLPGILFIGGFRSAMSGVKARWLDHLTAAWGLGYTRFDPLGHGETGGPFTQGDISTWLSDTLTVLDKVTQGPQILIGSSMGGWLMVLTALARLERLAGLIGIAAAPDFTARLIEPRLTPALRDALDRDGVFYRASAYGEPDPITARLLADGRKNLILNRTHNMPVPVRLLHGTEDADVPYQYSLALAQSLKSPDLKVTLLKGADHRLSHARNLATLAQTLAEFLGESP